MNNFCKKFWVKMHSQCADELAMQAHANVSLLLKKLFGHRWILLNQDFVNLFTASIFM